MDNTTTASGCWPLGLFAISLVAWIPLGLTILWISRLIHHS